MNKSTNLNKSSSLTPQLKFLKKETDPFHGEIFVYKRGDSEIFSTKFQTSNEKEALAIMEDCDKILAFNHPSLESMLDYSFAKEKNFFCSDVFSFEFFFFFPQHTLQQIHQQNPAFFDHKVLTKLLYQMVDVNYYMNQHNILHGDICPRNIFLDLQTQNFKLFFTRVKQNDHSQIKRLHKSKIVNQEELFLSPQIYRKFLQSGEKIEYDQEKEDVFNLAMTILQLGISQKVQNLY